MYLILCSIKGKQIEKGIHIIKSIHVKTQKLKKMYLFFLAIKVSVFDILLFTEF